jgi:alkanesulfonate monooxygenase SsuD/methylene tetrahydromethanopterin reductase-like flavin-dependent oxidoreductase (luciferase family)
MNVPRFGLNRFDSRSVDLFAADVRRAEMLGWDAALQPDSQLRRRDTYVLLAAAAKATERITLGPLLANPVNRHPSVTAGSIATIDELAPGRTIIGWGVGDTAVRLAGLRPARVKELEAGTRLMRALLDGESVDVGAEQPARPSSRADLDRRRRSAHAPHGGGSGRRSVHPRGNAPGEHFDGSGSDPGGGRGGRT